MKNNVLMKGILVLIVIALLTIGFTGCGTTIIATTPTYPTTGTVYVYTDSYDYYYIYMDNVWQGESYYTSSYTVIYNVPIGNHTFEASGYWYYGYKYQYISSGANYVTISTW
jgi:capsular polysaccharide biosynthesis protein